MANVVEGINVAADDTVRVFADISAEAEMKLRIRQLQHRAVVGRHVTRREYLEYLINQDVAKVSGASLREITGRANQKKG